MVEQKKSFIAYCDWQETFEALCDEKAGKLIKHLLSYANGEIPKLDDPILKIAFIAMRQQLSRDLKKYEDKKEVRSTAGRMGNLKRWHQDLFLRVEKNELTLEEAESIGLNRKTSDSDKSIANIAVNDTVIVNDTVTDIKKEKNKKKKSLRFYPPSVVEIYDYMLEKKIPDRLAKLESQKFWAFYDSKNWHVGKNKMVKWKSSASGWITRIYDNHHEKHPTINRQSAAVIASNSQGWEIK